jgi:peptide/nickel transport system substrate-binding protein
MIPKITRISAYGVHRALCALLVLSASIFGCSSDDPGAASKRPRSTPGEPDAGGRLVIGVQQEPERISEILNATASTQLVSNLIFSKFVKFDDSLNLIADVIEQVPTRDNGGISEDHLTYTYRLKRGVTWHDGAPLTSADAEFTYKIMTNPDVMVESREGWDVIERVETPDDHTITFHLREPYPDFVAETFNNEPVLPRHLLEAVPASEFHLADYHRAPVGSGAFEFVEWVTGSHITVRRSTGYYRDVAKLDEITVKFVPDDNNLLVQLQTGEIDLYDNANLSFLDQLQSLPGIVLYSTPTLMYEHLDFNTEHVALSDRRVRQAIALATDREEIATYVYRGKATVALLDEHPSSIFYSKKAAAAVQHDPAAARRLLYDAGWADSDADGVLDRDGRPLRLTISATAGNPDREKTELVLREQYRKVGIDLVVQNYSPPVMYGSYEDGGTLKRGKFDIAMYAWLSSPEPSSKRTLYGQNNIPPNGQNHPRFRHTRLTELLEEGAREIDPVRRISIYHAVSDILVEEVPVVPLFWYTTVDACSARLRNYKPNPTPSTDTWNAHTWFLERPQVEMTRNQH